jgi:hypothetical protein
MAGFDIYLCGRIASIFILSKKKGHPSFLFRCFSFKRHLYNDPHVSRHDFEVVSQFWVVDGDCFASIGDTSHSLHNEIIAVLENDVVSDVLLGVVRSEAYRLHGWLSFYGRQSDFNFLYYNCHWRASSSTFLDTATTSTSKMDGCCER